MRKLALTDDILMKIEKPARYIGNEVNSVMKDKTKVDIRFAMCFPDVYEIGMSHLGIQILYDMFNRREDVWCERVYSPWTDLDAVMREKKIPLFALESQDPIKNFDFLGITIQYEMCYTNILQILDLSGIPIKTKDRTEEDPIAYRGRSLRDLSFLSESPRPPPAPKHRLTAKARRRIFSLDISAALLPPFSPMPQRLFRK